MYQLWRGQETGHSHDFQSTDEQLALPVIPRLFAQVSSRYSKAADRAH